MVKTAENRSPGVEDLSQKDSLGDCVDSVRPSAASRPRDRVPLVLAMLVPPLLVEVVAVVAGGAQRAVRVATAAIASALRADEKPPSKRARLE